jgi:hypothetical protein
MIGNTLRLRPQHFYCELFLETYWPQYMDKVSEIRRVLRCEDNFLIVVTPQGPDDEICQVCPDLSGYKCSNDSGEEWANIDAQILKETGLWYGQKLTASELRGIVVRNWPLKVCCTCAFQRRRECKVGRYL